MSIKENLLRIQQTIPKEVCLVIVTKTHPPEKLQEVYDCGARIFGENRVQEMKEKYAVLPKDIEWHLIGHLQTNKVKDIAPFVRMIQSVDSMRLLLEIDKQAAKNNRRIDCLLQIYIASEETKFGLSFEEAAALINSPEFKSLQHIRICGLMGMASFTDNEAQVRKEFKSLHAFFEKLKAQYPPTENLVFQTLSMGMSGDYLLAVQEGSNLVRVGSAIFGKRG